MIAEDVQCVEDLGGGVIAEVHERAILTGDLRLSRVRIVSTKRLRPIGLVFSQSFAIMCFWIAGWAPFAPGSWMPEVVGRAFVAAFGLLLSYLGLVAYLNRTIVTLDGEKLVVRQSPLPMPGGCTLLVAAVTGVRSVVVTEEALYAVRVVVGLEERSAFSRLPSIDVAQRVAGLLEKSIDRVHRELPRSHLDLQPTPASRSLRRRS